MSVISTDVFVVGGGPAGLAAAIAARQRGFRVTVVDASRPPIEKACGEGIMPDGIEAARALGLKLEGCESFRFRGIRFCHGSSSVEADFPNGRGLGTRRTVLHRLMVQRAEQVGVDLRWNTRAGALDEVQARWIVGADGSQSMVRRLAGLDACVRDTRRYGFRRHYRVAPWSEFMEMHWGDGCQFYVTPVSAREICLVLISRDPKLRLDAALERFPRVAALLGGAEATDYERGAISVTRRLKRVCSGRVALVGDASGSVDAITGEGLCLLFQQSVALARAFEAEDLSLYEAEHRRIGRRPRWMGDLMLTMDRRPALRKAAMGAMAAQPWIFNGMLRMHVGQPL